MRSLVDEHRPACAYAQGKLWGPALTKYSREVDFILPEVLWWTAGWDLDRLALHRQVCVMASGGKMCMDAAKYDNTNVERRPCGGQVRGGQRSDCRLQPAAAGGAVSRSIACGQGRPGGLLGSGGPDPQTAGKRPSGFPDAFGALPAVARSAVNDMGPNLSDAYQLLRQHQIAVDLVDEVGSAAETFQPYDW